MVVAYGTLLNLAFFVTCQGLIKFKKDGYRMPEFLKLDRLFFWSFFSEALLVVLVSLFTLIFSILRNNHIPVEGHLDRSAAMVFDTAKHLLSELKQHTV